MVHRRGPRAALAVAVGVAVAVLAAFAMAAHDGAGVAMLLPEAAYTRGHGSNTVNVLLVDIRAWDTLGEIRSEEHTSELQSRGHLVCRPLLEKKRQHLPHGRTAEH